MKAVNSDLFFSNITIKLFQFILLFLVFISGPLSAKAQQSTEYISPDGHLKAVVESYNKKDNGYQGIKFEIQKINGEIIAQHQRKSNRGEVKFEKVSWTPDSQYFVISISDSDHLKIFPAYFYDRPFNRFRILPVRATNPHFEIINSDTVKILRLQICKPNKDICEGKFVEIKLSGLPKPVYELTDKQSFNNYTVKTFFNSEDGKGYLEIIQNGKTVFKQDGFKFRIGLIYTDDEFKKKGFNSLIAIGKDITGKGEPDLVVSEWSGGAHCCFIFNVFEIGKKFKKIATLDAADSDQAHFEDIRGNKKLVFVANDWTFAYWNACFAGSPAPDIILEFKDDKYVLANDLMRKPSPTQKALNDKIIIIRKNDSWKEGEPPAELWGYMLDLIYSGNAKVAWQFFDKAWLPGVAGKKEFMQSFQTQLEKSPYWTQIKKMNN
jgi:hypothetical protein